MRILTLTNLYPPDFIGGYELLCEQAVDALRARRHEVLVLTSAPHAPAPPVAHVQRPFRFFDTGDPPWNDKIGPLNYRLCGVQAAFISAFNVHALLTALAAFRPDVVYLHNLLGLGGLGLLACLGHLRVPWVWQLGDQVPRLLCSPAPEERCVPALVREYNRQIRGRYLACSRRVVAEVEAAGLRIRDQVELLPYWIDGERPPPRPRYFDGSHLRVASAGRVGPDKGADLLIEAAARLRADGFQNFSVDLYGRADGPGYPARIDHLGLREWVRLMGVRPRAEVVDRLRDYDVFAFPTWDREPFGVAPLEAAARGCVPLISRCCGVAEWLMHGVHCLKAERTAEAFADVLKDILEGKISLAPLGRRGAAVAWRDFHIDALLPRIERALAGAARADASGAGTPEEAYRLALLAERTVRVLVHESFAA